jgi:serine/threonine-protein kinase NIM1
VASPNSGSSSQFFVSSQKNFASLYEKLLWQHQYDEASQKDVTLGRRVGFYKFKSELGSGNFSKVKLAIHQITKGKINVELNGKISRSKLPKVGWERNLIKV